MPELPEVETTRRGLAPHLLGQRITAVEIRDHRLRWPVPLGLPGVLAGQTVRAVDRRAKYLLLRCDAGTLMVHLGMSGSLRLVNAAARPGKHEHWDIVLADGGVLRYRDPRRFGSLHWIVGEAADHPLLRELGPEPLSSDFTGERLYALSRRRRVPVKVFLMDSRVVVGVGNIYASEALYRAGIRPDRPAGRVALRRYDRLADAVRAVLQDALACGGTTLRDFVGGEGRPGYFKQDLQVYGRAGQQCRNCGNIVLMCRLGQRASYFCGTCQR